MPTAEFIIDRMTVGPVLPATILVGLLVLYTIVAMIGLIDLDMGLPDLDLPDVDVPDMDIPDGFGGDVAAEIPGDVQGEGPDLDLLGGIGGAALRWVNLGRVPLIIWGGVFTVAFWSISYTLWHRFDATKYEPLWLATTMLTLRNAVLAIVVTKWITWPMVKHFVPTPTYDTDRIVGSTCEVVSLEATPNYGQAKFRTHAAPLLLNIRTEGEQTFAKGEEVRIVRFDPAARIYHVAAIGDDPSVSVTESLS